MPVETQERIELGAGLKEIAAEVVERAMKVFGKNAGKRLKARHDSIVKMQAIHGVSVGLRR